MDISQIKKVEICDTSPFASGGGDVWNLYGEKSTSHFICQMEHMTMNCAVWCYMPNKWHVYDAINKRHIPQELNCER